MSEKVRPKWHPASIVSKFVKFFRDQKSEIKKIVWPSKKQVFNNTGIVLIVTALAAVIVGGFDWILGLLVNLFLG